MASEGHVRDQVPTHQPRTHDAGGIVNSTSPLFCTHPAFAQGGDGSLAAIRLFHSFVPLVGIAHAARPKYAPAALTAP